MCGIAGIAFADPAQRPEKQMLERMAAILHHRGPDSGGFHIGDGIGMGVRRLSIIDTAKGDQPITNEDGSVVVICNGEIYNYLELRERLLKAGHQFRTHSDIEVIAHLYEEDPDHFLVDLRGMFGLAIWDASRRRLLLARDRFGIKPLHYTLTKQGLIFGSELKAILASGLVEPARDPHGAKDLFTFGFVRAPHTMLKNVLRLLPGQCLLFSSGTVTNKVYWDVTFPRRHEYDTSKTPNEWADNLREKFAESVALHLRSDVPVGAWLSGGIDSSAVTAMMSRLRQPVHTFTLGFENRDVDELSRNRLLDEFPSYGCISHRTECKPEHFRLLPRAVWHREQPFGLGVDVSQMIISDLTARHVKVVLAGEGSDEILGGYSWYRAYKFLRPMDRFPKAIRHGVAQLLSSAGRQGASRILKSPAGLNQERFCALIGSASLLNSRPHLFTEDIANAAGSIDDPNPLVPLPSEFDSWHPFAQLQFLDIKMRLAELVIPHLDLLSMANSVEARVPFLDHPFAEFCATIPPWLKMRGYEEKSILRRAMHGILPEEIRKRKKFPLSAPTRDWVDAALPEFADTFFSTDQLKEKAWFDPASVSDLAREHRSGQFDHSRLLLMILTTQMWDDLFLKRFNTVHETGIHSALQI